MTTKLPAYVTPVPDALFQEMEGETVFLEMDSGEYYGIDDVGTRMWKALTDCGDVEAAVARLLTEFDVEEARLRADLAVLIEQMRAAGLVKVS